MRAVRRSPLFRIALLALAVLCAHTVRANTQPIVPICPPCPGKVAAAQPSSEKKLFPASKRSARPPRPDARSSFGAPPYFLAAHPAAVLFLRRPGQIAVALRTVHIPAQRRPFALRL